MNSGFFWWREALRRRRLDSARSRLRKRKRAIALPVAEELELPGAGLVEDAGLVQDDRVVGLEGGVLDAGVAHALERA